MGLLTDLRMGTHGIRVEFPPSMPIEEEAELDLVLRDDTRPAQWHVGLMLAMVDLGQQHNALLMADLERDAKSAFDANFHARPAQAGAPSKVPRTSDPQWSPLVSVQRTTVGGAEALVVIHRLTYEPGDETVAGRLIIPLERGTLHVSALARATFTGFRESLLTAQVLGQLSGRADRPAGDHPLSQAEAADELRQALPSQAQIDDPALDESLPEHPLSVVRAALHWLLAGGLAIDVTQPWRGNAALDIELPSVGCFVTPPPRFLFTPWLAERSTPNQVPFTRACLPDMEPQIFEVWRVPDVHVRGIGSGWRLKRLAARSIRGWAREGATDIKVTTWSLPPLNGRTRVGSYVRFRCGDSRAHFVAHLVADHDGTVFRLAASGPLDIDREQLGHHVNLAADTWRRRIQ